MKKYLPILLLIFVNGLGFSIFFPVFPFLIEDYGVSSFWYGLLLSVYSLGQFFAGPVFWAWSDHHGRKPLLIWSQFGTLLSLLTFVGALFLPHIMIGGVILPLWVILFSRIIDGITGGNNGVAMAYLSDITHGKNKAKAFGLMGAVFGISMIIGPAIGWTAVQYRWYVGVWLVAAGISLITLLYMIFGLEESLHVDKRDMTPVQLGQALNVFTRFNIISNFPKVIRLFWVYGLFAIMFMGYTSTNILYAKEYLGFGPAQISSMYIIIGLFLIINQGFTVRKLLDIVDEKKLFLSGIVSVSLSLLVYIVEPGIILFYISAFLSTLGIALCMATFKGIITQVVDHSAQGKIIGLDESVMSGSRVIVPALAAGAFAIWGHRIFVVFGVIGLVALWLDWRITREVG